MEENQSPAPETKSFFAKEKRPLLIAIAAAVVVVAVLLIVLIGNCGPKAAARNFARAVISCDVDRINKRCAFDVKAFAIAKAEENDIDEEEFFEGIGDYLCAEVTSWKSMSRALRNYMDEALRDDLGRYRVEIKVTKVKELSARKLQEEASELPGDKFYDVIEDYGFDPDKVKSGAEVTLKIRFIGKEDTGTLTVPIYMAKIGGSWKFLMVGDLKNLDNLKAVVGVLF